MLHPKLMVIPCSYESKGAGPDGSGLSFKAKYTATGKNGLDLPSSSTASTRDMRVLDPAPSERRRLKRQALAFSSSRAFATAMRRSLSTRERATDTLVAPFELEVPIREEFYLLEPIQKTAHRDAGQIIEWLLERAQRDRGDA